MNWLNIKKYTPHGDAFYLVFTECGQTYIARHVSGNAPDAWICDYFCQESSRMSHQKIHGITHFCVIEPVEIDE